MSAAPAYHAPADSTAAIYVGYVCLSRLLASIGVTVILTPLPGQDAAQWDPHHRVLHLNQAASITERTHALGASWRRIVLGPHASTAEPIPPVRAVLHSV